MRKQTLVICEYCLTAIFKDDSEVKRSIKLGRKLFCDLSCAVSYQNEPKKNKTIELTCPCGKKFNSHTGAKAAKHCSTGCASKYSMTEYRKTVQTLYGIKHKNNLIKATDLLKLREHWKYSAIENYLQLKSRKYEFEFKLEKYVYDLVLFDSNSIIEFDGKYHKYGKQIDIDNKKDIIARTKNFRIFRIKTESSGLIELTNMIQCIIDNN